MRSRSATNVIPIVHFWLLQKVVSVCSHIVLSPDPTVSRGECILCRKCLCVLTHRFCVRRKGGTGGDGWGHLQGAMHMMAADVMGPWLALGGPILALAA